MPVKDLVIFKKINLNNNLEILLFSLIISSIYSGYFWLQLFYIEGLSSEVYFLTRNTDPVYMYFYNKDFFDNVFFGNTFAPNYYGSSTGIPRLPLIVILPDILLYKFFGVIGSILFDFFWLTLRIYILIRLLIRFGIYPIIAIIFSLTSYFWLHTGELIGVQYAGSLLDDRLFRPNVTIVIFLLTLYHLINLIESREVNQKIKYCFILGFLNAILVQSNIWASQVSLISSATIITFFLKDNYINKCRYICYASFAFFFTLLPLIFTLVHGSTEQIVRLGYLEIHHEIEAIVSYILRITYWYAFPILSIFFIGLILIFFYRPKVEFYTTHRNSFFVIFCILASTILSFPIATILIGKTIQPRHYLYELATYFDLLYIFVICLFVQKTIFMDKKLILILQNYRVSIFLLISIFFIIFPQKDLDFVIHRSDDGKLETLHDFDDIIQKIENQNFSGFLATNSGMLGAYWAGINDSNLIMPHSAASTLSMNGLAIGVTNFAKLVELKEDEFIDLINDWSIQDMFIGHFKYLKTRFSSVGTNYKPELELSYDIFSKAPLIMPEEDKNLFIKTFRVSDKHTEDVLIILHKKHFFNKTILDRTSTIYENQSYVIKRND